jgi:hypothetical protein
LGGACSVLSIPHPKYFKEIHVRYYDDGSKKLNACIQFFLHMVYL